MKYHHLKKKEKLMKLLSIKFFQVLLDHKTSLWQYSSNIIRKAKSSQFEKEKIPNNKWKLKLSLNKNKISQMHNQTSSNYEVKQSKSRIMKIALLLICFPQSMEAEGSSKNYNRAYCGSGSDIDFADPQGPIPHHFHIILLEYSLN